MSKTKNASLSSLFLNDKGTRIDQNKVIAIVGAVFGGIILFIATLFKFDNLEWLLGIYLMATLGQLPSKGLHDLGRLRIESQKRD